MSSPERKRSLLKRCRWDKVSNNPREGPSNLVLNRVTGLCYKIVSLVLSSWRKSNNLSSRSVIQKLKSHTKTSDFGSLASPTTDSLSAYSKRSSKSPTNHPKVSKPVFTKPSLPSSTNNSSKKSTTQTGKTSSSPFAIFTRSSFKDVNSVLSVGVYLMSSTTQICRPRYLSLRNISTT